MPLFQWDAWKFNSPETQNFDKNLNMFAIPLKITLTLIRISAMYICTLNYKYIFTHEQDAAYCTNSTDNFT